jgi:predicted GIY-YIG superfamily endonuclease
LGRHASTTTIVVKRCQNDVVYIGLAKSGIRGRLESHQRSKGAQRTFKKLRKMRQNKFSRWA